MCYVTPGGRTSTAVRSPGGPLVRRAARTGRCRVQHRGGGGGHGPLDTALFETALRRTVSEADTFALRFADTDDGPRCHLAPDAERLDPAPGSTVSGAEDPGAAAWAHVRADLATPVDLEKGPLFAHTLLTLAPTASSGC
ncbi:hypothetical protein GCM10023238_29970 [Streptomyces heliomycini]